MSYPVILVPGDGIGPEIAQAAREALDATGVKIDWTVMEAGAAQIEKYGAPLPPDTVAAIQACGAALKGPITTPLGTGFRSVNVQMRKEMDLYANLRPTRTFKGVPSRFDRVDIVVVRENTEDLYAGVEHMVGADAAESIKIFTRKGCERILRFAFEYAVKNHRSRVTAVHKANIMKCTDGMFLDIARKMAPEYPAIRFDDKIIDALCMGLVQTPEEFDVLACPNLYGDIVSDLCAGLVGGPGLAPSANIGHSTAVFEAVHGSAPQIAGQDIANPTALILSGAMMLRHLGEKDAAARVENAVAELLGEGVCLTRDLGGKFGTKAYTAALIRKIEG